jgi:hypothetical protein
MNFTPREIVEDSEVAYLIKERMLTGSADNLKLLKVIEGGG